MVYKTRQALASEQVLDAFVVFVKIYIDCVVMLFRVVQSFDEVD